MKKYDFPLAAASCALSALPFIFPALWMISWIAPVPVFFVMIRRLSLPCRKRGAWLFSFVASASYFLVADLWTFFMYPPDALRFSESTEIFTRLLVYLGITLLLSLPMSFAPFFAHLVCRGRPALFPLVFAASTVAVELFEGVGFWGMTFARFAHTQYKCPAVIASASLFGEEFISFVMIFFAASAAYVIVTLRSGKRVSASFTAPAAVLAAASLVFGAFYCLNTSPERTVKTAILQGNVDSADKFSEDTSGILSLYSDLVDLAFADEDTALAVTPEAIVAYSKDSEKAKALFREKASEHSRPIIFGTPSWEGYDKYNCVYAADENGDIVGTYRKQKLVAFGEYTPPVFSFLDMNASGSDFSAGKGSEVYEAAGVKIGSLICFDGLFSEFSRAAARDGAEVIALSTNDSWFNAFGGREVLFATSVFRAVESGRAVVRAANTGVSAVIDKNGRTLAECEKDICDVLVADVPVYSALTFYDVCGDVPICVFTFFALIISVLTVKKGRKEHGSYQKNS